tara:strand:+ start:294 stop:428 length:135 start_codon:yes stop_codon:yes gene_type:complete
MNKEYPWHHIKDVLSQSSKEVVNGFEDIALMLVGKKRKFSKSKK